MSRTDRPILTLENVNTYYGLIQALRDVSLEIGEGEIVCLLGGNASGKSTTLKTILGIAAPARGTIIFDGTPIHQLNTRQIVGRGITMVPENRRLFHRMTVQENLVMGAYLREDRENLEAELERVFDLFPRVKERLNQQAGTLSGGEQQMVAIGRALMARPKLLLMDEPSMGLAPLLVEQTFDIIQEINARGTTVFVVEQNANMALSIADYGYVLQTGQIVLADNAEALRSSRMMRQAYLGET